MNYIFSIGYRLSRWVVVTILTAWQRLTGQLIDLEPAIRFGDAILERLGPWMPQKKQTGSLITVYDLTFPNPVTAAAFKSELPILDFWLRIGLGGVCIKTILPKPSHGNARPRIREITRDGQPALINAMGLPGDGVDALLKKLTTARIWQYGRPIGISIGGHSLEEYQTVAKKVISFLNGMTHPAYIEVNISCPNTQHGRSLSEDIDALNALLETMCANTSRVISVKLSPDQSNDHLIKTATMIATFDKMMLTVGNTQYKTCEQLGLSSDAISVGGGGTSGPPLYPRTKELVTVLRPIGLPIIATGGVTTRAQVTELLGAGATLVGMATALIKDPFKN